MGKDANIRLYVYILLLYPYIKLYYCIARLAHFAICTDPNSEVFSLK